MYVFLGKEYKRMIKELQGMTNLNKVEIIREALYLFYSKEKYGVDYPKFNKK